MSSPVAASLLQTSARLPAPPALLRVHSLLSALACAAASGFVSPTTQRALGQGWSDRWLLIVGLRVWGEGCPSMSAHQASSCPHSRTRPLVPVATLWRPGPSGHCEQTPGGSSVEGHSQLPETATRKTNPIGPPLYPDIGESCISQPLKPSVQPEAGGLRTSGHQVERGQSWP